MTFSHSQLSEQDISELASFFDLLAMFDFEDAKQHQVISEEIGKGLSLTEREASSRVFQEKTNKNV
jgi:hypothetical protein